MRSGGFAVALLCLIAVSLEAPHLPPGFVTCAHKFKGGHEWVGQVNSNLCYKRIGGDEDVHKKVAQTRCEEYEKPSNPNEPASHLPYLKTQADRNAFLTLTFEPCALNRIYCYYWVGIEMISYVPGNVYWYEPDGRPKKFEKGVAQYRWDDGTMENDWDRADFIQMAPENFWNGAHNYDLPIRDHKYLIAGGRAVRNGHKMYIPQRFWMTPSQLKRNYNNVYCQKIINSRLSGPPLMSTTPTTPPLPSKHTQPTTVRIYTRRTVLVRQTGNSSRMSTRMQVIVPSSSEEGGLSSTLMYILAGGFGVLLVVAMLIAGVYGMHSKGNRRRHKRKGHKVKTNEDEPSSSTTHIDTNGSTTEHS